MNSTYENWAFRDNPFDTTALPALNIGETLLVGRNDELSQLTRRLLNQPQIVTIEGDNGIGKTSLINVAIYRLLMDYMAHKKTSPLFIPCKAHFQLSNSQSVNEIVNDVYFQVAETLIDYSDDLQKVNVSLPSNFNEVKNWIRSIKVSKTEGGLDIGIINASYASEMNSSFGFEKVGFGNLIKGWLNHLFPQRHSGGVVCVIDNMELLESSSIARKNIERLRDTLFNQPGLRWVLCGSNGIITSLAASPRLEGVLHEPIIVNPLSKTFIKDVFQRRLSHYSVREDFYMPLTIDTFKFLYEILKYNIRNTLNYANSFCLWVLDGGKYPNTDQEKHDSFWFWIVEKSKNYHHEIKKHISDESYFLFAKIINQTEGLALDDYKFFEVHSKQKMERYVKELESVGLVEGIFEDQDGRRRTIHVTPKGRFVGHAIKNFNLYKKEIGGHRNELPPN